MVHELVNRFIDVKLAERDTSVALYRIAAEHGGDAIVDRTRQRFPAAMTAILPTGKLPRSADVPFMVHCGLSDHGGRASRAPGEHCPAKNDQEAKRTSG
jgi:hypothetical protein